MPIWPPKADSSIAISGGDDMDLTRAIQGGMTLAGAFGSGDDAYQRQMSQTAQMEGLLAQARMRRDQERARAELGDSLRALGHNPALATVLNAGHNPMQVSGYGGDMQIQDFRRGALNEALNGDLQSANAFLAAINGKPLELTDIRGQNTINPYAENGWRGVTPIGKKQMEYTAAQASAADALARQRIAQTLNANEEHVAKLNGSWNPSARAPGSWTEPSADLLYRVFGGTDGMGNPQIDPKREADFTAWRGAHPEYTNGNQALNVYQNQFLIRPQGGSRMHLIDGSQPFMENEVTKGQQIPGAVAQGAPEPKTDEERREFLMAAQDALRQGGDRALIEARLAQYGLSLDAVDGL